MTWDDLDPTRDTTDERLRQQQAQQAKAAALRQACSRILTEKSNTELKEYLQAIAWGFSYTSGRSAEDVAFAEGRRKLAVELLKLGEVTDE